MESPFIALLQIVKAFETNNIEYVVVGSVASSIHGAEDTILAKLKWYRLGAQVSELQWRDVKGILGTKKAILDHDYLNSCAARIGVLDLLARAEEELQQ